MTYIFRVKIENLFLPASNVTKITFSSEIRLFWEHANIATAYHKFVTHKYCNKIDWLVNIAMT